MVCIKRAGRDDPKETKPKKRHVRQKQNIILAVGGGGDHWLHET